MQELSRGRGESSPERRGTVLVAALLAVMVGAGMLLGLMQVGVSFNREYTSRFEAERARAIAEAGLAESVLAMRRGGTGVVGSEGQPAVQGDGLFWTTVTQIGGDLRRVVSNAAVGSARVSLEQLVFHYSDELVDAAVFARDRLVLEANVTVDSFDSTAGTYADQLGTNSFVSENAIVQSNGDIILDATTEVHGDVHPGHGDSLMLASNAVVTHTTESMVEDREIPPVDVPPIPMGGAAFITKKTVLPPGDYGASGLYVSGKGRLVIQGPSRLVLGEWVMDSGSEVVMDNSTGPIEVYALGNVRLRSNSSLATVTKSATDFTLFLAGDETQRAVLRSNSEFYGMIYGPEALVDIHSNFEVFGAVVADRLILNSYTKIHYDEALRSLITNEKFVPGRMSPAAFPNRRLLVNRRDPFQVLGLDPSSLPVPDAAHETTE